MNRTNDVGETEYDLIIVQSATVDSAGIARIDNIGPTAPFERWEIGSTQIANNGTARTMCEIFNNPSRTQLVEGSYSGNLDTSDTKFSLRSGQYLYYRWSRGTPGSLSTLTVRGRKFVAGRRGG